jgi:hypothetical protein
MPVIVTCEFNQPNSVSQAENHPTCDREARILLVALHPTQGYITEMVCAPPAPSGTYRGDMDHYQLAHDWLSALGEVHEFALADVTGRIAS